MRGSELRIAETRAVNRALRKAYGIGICSVEELGCPTSATNTAQHQLDANLVKSYAIDFCGTKTCVRPRANRSRTSSFTLPTGRERIVMSCSAN